MAGECGPHQRPERLRPIGVAPAEVVEDRDALRVGADGHAVADGFIDGAGRHVIGIEVAVAGVHAAGDHQAAVRIEHRAQHGRVARAVVGDADQRLDDAAALHFVIVLPDHPFLAGDVQGSEDAQQVGCDNPALRAIVSGETGRGV